MLKLFADIFFFSAALRSIWYLSSLDKTHASCMGFDPGRQSLNHWTTREVPADNFQLDPCPALVYSH